MTADPLNDSHNPYAVSDFLSTEPERSFESGALQIEGDLLKVGPVVQLPEICIVSGETEDLVPVTKKLSYASPFVIVLFVLSPLIGLIVYLIIRKQTRVTFYLSRFVRSQNRWKSFYGFLCLVATVATLIGIVANDAVDQMPLLLLIPLFLFIAGIVMLVKGSNQMSVRRFEKPDSFWIKGAKPPFLEAIAMGSGYVRRSGF